MLLLSWVVGTFQYKGFERKSSGRFYLTTCGDFYPAYNGGSRPTLTAVLDLINNRPRKCLGFLSPLEFIEKVLHLD